jgi:hypothetical protein
MNRGNSVSASRPDGSSFAAYESAPASALATDVTSASSALARSCRLPYADARFRPEHKARDGFGILFTEPTARGFRQDGHKTVVLKEARRG